MIKHKFVLILLIAWAFTVAHVSAQSQRGYAVIQNSNKKALPQVSVIVAGAQPTTTDADGRFSLSLPNHQKGQRLMVQDISYHDYVVVNKHQVDQWVYAPSVEYRIDMCPTAEYQQRVEQFHRIGRTNNEKSFERKLAELKKQKEQGVLKAEQYAKLRKEATEELKRTSKLIDAYAPMLAAINSDYLQPIERQAQALAEQGKVDEAVRLYEDLKLQDKFHRGIDMKKQWDDDIEALIPSLERFSQTLVLQGGAENFHRAGAILKDIADSNPKHALRNAEYAEFAYLQGKSTEAEVYYNRVLSQPDIDRFKRVEWKLKIADIYYERGDLNKSADVYEYTIKLIQDLPSDYLATGQLLIMADINFSTVLLEMANLFEADGQAKDAKQMYKEACFFLEQAKGLLEVLKDDLPDYSKTYFTCCTNLLIVYRHLGYTKQERQIMLVLDGLKESADKGKSQSQIAVSKAESAFMKGDVDESVRQARFSYEQLEPLFRSNPERYRRDMLQTLALLGACLNKARQYAEAIPFFEKAEKIYKTDKTEDNQIRDADVLDNVYQNYFNALCQQKRCDEVCAKFEDYVSLVGVGNNLLMDVPSLYPILMSFFSAQNYSILVYDELILDVLKNSGETRQLYKHTVNCYFYLAAMYRLSGDFSRADALDAEAVRVSLKFGYKAISVYDKINHLAVKCQLRKPEEVLSQIQEIETAMKKYTGGNDISNQYHMYTCALVAQVMQKKYVEAEKTYRKLESLNPGDDSEQEKCIAALAMVAAYMEQGLNADAAIDKCTAAVEKLGENMPAFAYEGLIDFAHVTAYYAKKNGDLDSALQLYEQALDSEMKWIDICPERATYIAAYTIQKKAEALFAKGNREKALNCHEVACKLFFDNHSNQKLDNYASRYFWCTVMLLPDELHRFEREMRLADNAYSGYCIKAFYEAVTLADRDDPSLVDFISLFKKRTFGEEKKDAVPGFKQICRYYLNGTDRENLKLNIRKILLLLGE